MIEAFRNVVFECEELEGGREKGPMTETFRNVAQFSLLLCTYNLLYHNPTIPQSTKIPFVILIFSLYKIVIII